MARELQEEFERQERAALSKQREIEQCSPARSYRVTNQVSDPHFNPYFLNAALGEAADAGIPLSERLSPPAKYWKPVENVAGPSRANNLQFSSQEEKEHLEKLLKGIGISDKSNK